MTSVLLFVGLFCLGVAAVPIDQPTSPPPAPPQPGIVLRLTPEVLRSTGEYLAKHHLVDYLLKSFTNETESCSPLGNCSLRNFNVSHYVPPMLDVSYAAGNVVEWRFEGAELNLHVDFATRHETDVKKKPVEGYSSVHVSVTSFVAEMSLGRGFDGGLLITLNKCAVDISTVDHDLTITSKSDDSTMSAEKTELIDYVQRSVNASVTGALCKLATIVSEMPFILHMMNKAMGIHEGYEFDDTLVRDPIVQPAGHLELAFRGRFTVEEAGSGFPPTQGHHSNGTGPNFGSPPGVGPHFGSEFPPHVNETEGSNSSLPHGAPSLSETEKEEIIKWLVDALLRGESSSGSDVRPSNFSLPSEEPSMAAIYISDYFINSLWDVFFNKGWLSVSLTKDMFTLPYIYRNYANLFDTSSEDTFSFARIFPNISDNHPNASVKFAIKATAAPLVDFGCRAANTRFQFNLSILIPEADGTQLTLATLPMSVSMSTDISFISFRDRVVTVLTFPNVRVTDLGSPPEFLAYVPRLESVLQTIADSIVVPVSNILGGIGLPLYMILPTEIRLDNLDVSFEDGVFRIGTDICYDPTSKMVFEKFWNNTVYEKFW